MKTLPLWAKIAFLVALAGSILLYFNINKLFSPMDGIGIFSQAKGDVTMRPQAALWMPVNKGTAVPARSAVKTGKKSWALIRFANDRQMYIAENSYVIVQEQADKASVDRFLVRLVEGQVAIPKPKAAATVPGPGGKPVPAPTPKAGMTQRLLGFLTGMAEETKPAVISVETPTLRRFDFTDETGMAVLSRSREGDVKLNVKAGSASVVEPDGKETKVAAEETKAASLAFDEPKVLDPEQTVTATPTPTATETPTPTPEPTVVVTAVPLDLRATPERLTAWTTGSISKGKARPLRLWTRLAKECPQPCELGFIIVRGDRQKELGRMQVKDKFWVWFEIPPDHLATLAAEDWLAPEGKSGYGLSWAVLPTGSTLPAQIASLRQVSLRELRVPKTTGLVLKVSNQALSPAFAKPLWLQQPPKSVTEKDAGTPILVKTMAALDALWPWLSTRVWAMPDSNSTLEMPSANCFVLGNRVAVIAPEPAPEMIAAIAPLLKARIHFIGSPADWLEVAEVRKLFAEGSAERPEKLFVLQEGVLSAVGAPVLALPGAYDLVEGSGEGFFRAEVKLP